MVVWAEPQFLWAVPPPQVALSPLQMGLPRKVDEAAGAAVLGVVWPQLGSSCLTRFFAEVGGEQILPAPGPQGESGSSGQTMGPFAQPSSDPAFILGDGSSCPAQTQSNLDFGVLGPPALPSPNPTFILGNGSSCPTHLQPNLHPRR